MQKIREYFRTRMAARLWLALVGTVLCVTLCILLLAAVLFNGFMMGNAAGAGAQLSVQSREEYRRCSAIAEGTEFLELALHPQFQKAFIRQLDF